MIPEDLTKRLLEDRIDFKLYAAEQHLLKLKEIDKKYNNILKDRINTEMEIDCFFAQLIGAWDSLLVHINEKLDLGIPIEDVNLGSINLKLIKVDKQFLISELNNLSSKPGSWLYLLNDLRNYSLHRSMLRKHIDVAVFENTNINRSYSSKTRVSFLVSSSNQKKIPMDKTVIDYLKESLDRMRNLIKR